MVSSLCVFRVWCFNNVKKKTKMRIIFCKTLSFHFFPSFFSSFTTTDTQPSKPSISTTAAAGLELPADGFFLTATALAKLGVRFMFGVVGIPVTQLATAAQACGIRYIGCRNEQAAGYAAGAAGFLTGVPAVLLTVSGPGVVHGLAGLSNSQINCWPMIMISGSCETVRG